MADEKKGYVYVVGYMQRGPRPTDDRSADSLMILGDYTASTPEGAVEAALADGRNNGGVPNPESAPMVAVVKSRWYEIQAVGTPTVEWSLTRREEGGQSGLPLSEAPGGGFEGQ